MRKLIAIFLIGILLISGVLASGTSLNFSQKDKESIEFTGKSTPVFKVKDIRQDPFPSQPGSALDLYFRIDNMGGAVKGPKFELMLPYPFTLDPSTRNDDFTSIEAGDKLTLHYRVNVDKNALPDNYEVEFRAYAEPGIYYPYFLTIKVDDVTTDFDVALQEVTKEGVSIALSNIGKNTANAITVNVENQEDFELLGATSFIIGNLNNGDYTVVSALMKPKDANKKDLKLKVRIDYTDTIGNRRTLYKELAVIMSLQTKKGFEDLTAFVVLNDKVNGKNGGFNFYKYSSLILVLALITTIIYYRRKKKDAEEE